MLLVLDFDQRSFEVTGVKNKVKFQTNLNGKSNSVNVLAWDQHRKKSTVTSLTYG